MDVMSDEYFEEIENVFLSGLGFNLGETILSSNIMLQIFTLYLHSSIR